MSSVDNANNYCPALTKQAFSKLKLTQKQI